MPRQQRNQVSRMTTKDPDFTRLENIDPLQLSHRPEHSQALMLQQIAQGIVTLNNNLVTMFEKQLTVQLAKQQRANHKR